MFRKPIVPNITWLPVKNELNSLNISGPDDIRMDVFKVDGPSDKFWSSLNLDGNVLTHVKEDL